MASENDKLDYKWLKDLIFNYLAIEGLIKKCSFYIFNKKPCKILAFNRIFK